MIICIAGKNNIAVEIAEFVLQRNIVKKDNLYIIINKTDDGIDRWQRSLKKYSNENNLLITSLDEIYNIENLLFLSLEFDQIIKPYLFKSKNLFNIHFSLLPKYKGMFTSIIPILNNETKSGVTLHKIDKGIDTGDIIVQKEFKLYLNDNSRDLYLKYIEYGIELIKNNIKKLIINDYLTKKQNYMNSTYYSKNSIDFKNINIDLNQTAINIHNQIRAYNFREYQIPKLFGTSIFSSKILTTSSNFKIGTVIMKDDISFTIKTIDYDIVIYKDKVNELFEACKNNDINLVNKLLSIPNILNVQNEKGWTPLIVAVYNNNKNIVKALIKNNADINITNFNGTTLLMYAKDAYVKYHDREIIDLLISIGININQKDYKRKNVFNYCIQNNEIEVMNIIKGKY